MLQDSLKPNDPINYFCRMKVVLSGATSGIGKAIAIELANAGFSVAFIARSKEKAEDLISILAKSDSQKHFYMPGDHTRQAVIDEFCNEIKLRWKEPDIIINNAGVYESGLASEMSEALLMSQLDRNFWHAFRITQPWLNVFKKRGSGNIIFIGSVVTKQARSGAAAYTISKGLLDQYAHVLAEELRDFGVAVTRIVPGSVNTPSWDQGSVPQELFVQPQEIARLVISLLKLSKTSWLEEVIIRPLDKNW
jgi:NAD(P)-dependent dehydrogenase (short-subunit alcohol dehydrogenase family)